MNRIICERNNDKHIDNLYVVAGGERYYLFSQTASKSVYNYFKNGINVGRAGDFSKAGDDRRLAKTISKLIPYIKYVEKEYDLALLESTEKRRIESIDKRRKAEKSKNACDFLEKCA